MYIFHSSNNREIKISLAYLHAFILQCFPNYKKNGYLGRLICHIFGISTVNFGLGVKANGMAFQTCSVLFRFVALLPQSDKTSQNHNEYRMLSSFARTLPSKLHHLLVWIQKTLITQSPLLAMPSSCNQSNLFTTSFYHG